MNVKRRLISAMLGVALILVTFASFGGFASLAQEEVSYEPVSIGMKVVSFKVVVNGAGRGGIIEIEKLNNAGNYCEGVLNMDQNGNISAYVPALGGKYGMTINSGSTTNMSFSAHSDPIYLSGNVNDSSYPGNRMNIPCETGGGHYVAALLFDADYQESEDQYDSLDQTINAINLASSNGYYECELNGKGTISIDNTGDNLVVNLYLSASSYKDYVYGRLENEGDGGGLQVTMTSSADVDFTPSIDTVPPDTHDIIYNPPTDPGEFSGDTPIDLPLIGVLVGGAVGVGLISKKKKKNKKKREEEEQSQFKMILNKDFDNKLRKGDPPKKVYAKIVEIKGEKQKDHPQLTSMITVSSYDNSLTVQDGGMEKGYKCALASVPDGNRNPAGLVTFTLNSQAGRFQQSVMFEITEPQIFFAQDNLGLPANKLKFAKAGKTKNVGNQTYRLPFGVREMGDDVRVSVSLTRAGVTNIDPQGGKVTLPQDLPFSIRIERDDKNKCVFEAVISEILDYELPAGNTEGFKMHLLAETGVKGREDYRKVETDFPLYRIHLGLVFILDADSIGCYAQIKSERQGMKYVYLTEAERMGLGMTMAAAGMPDLGTDSWGRGRTLGTDYEPCYTGGSLLLFLYREEDMSIVRMPVSPDSNKPLDVRVKRLTSDRYCHKSDANENHQEMVDKLKITAFGTGELLQNGAHKIRICSTEGRLDPPIRFIAELEITVMYEGKEYSAKKNVHLRSQPFRIPKNEQEEKDFLKADKHIAERLQRIQDQIDHGGHMSHLFSLYDMIDRMLDGYQFRFGYDAIQVQNVMQIWTEYLEGKFVGANAKAEGVTLADELHACYAFMEGLRDNTGFLGRVAMGVMTGGISEYVFTTMTLAEEMKKRVFECKGDEDYGFWDAVWLGTKEFGKQIVTEYALKGVVSGTNIYLKAVHDIDIAAYVSKLGKSFQAKVDKFDMCLQKNVKYYREAKDAFNKINNFFNSSAKHSKAAIEKEIVSYEQSFSKAKELSKKARSRMTPKELKMVDEYYDAMSEGMRKVRKMQKIQQRMEMATNPKELALAKEQYRKIANEVWTDKNALKQLQNVKGEYANRLRAQFNHYREGLLDTVQMEALDDIAKEMGVPRDQLYVMNASNGSKASYKAGKKVPGDRDISFKQKVLSDRTKDLTINQSTGQNAVARKLFKKMNGREPESLQEALDFMKGKDVTYVHPEGDSAMKYVFEHNLDGYEDLEGMVGMKVDGTMDKSLLGKELHNKFINQKSVAHKGKEWFHMSNESVEEAIKLEAKAAKLTGQEAEAMLADAQRLRYFSQGQTVEGVRQITKQINNIAIPRSIAKHGMNVIPYEAMELHRIALRVGDTLSPAEFVWILKNDFGMTLDGFADFMSKYVE